MDIRKELFIGGRFEPPSSSATIEVFSPSTEELVGRIPAAGPDEMDRAVAAARSAFDEGDWPWMPLSERAEAMRRIAAGLWARQDEISTTITTEMGAPISQSRLGQAPAPIAMLEYYAGLAEQLPAPETRVGPFATSTILREPVGVVAGIVPWNGPLWLSMFKLAPALLAGCTIVLKPDPLAPLSSYILAEAIEAAGLPAGVVSIVASEREAGHHLVTHPGVDKVAFTGSTATGRRIMESCAGSLKRVTLELGGKSAAIFLDDADLEVALEQFLPGAVVNNGEACSALTRILVPESRHDEIMGALCATFAALPVGDPFDEATVFGPLISAAHRERVEGYIGLAREEGAIVVQGGGRPAGLDRGHYVEPTVLADVSNDMRVAREEIFGPVFCVIPYRGDAEAISLANDSDYGLAGCVYTADPERGFAVARRVRAGTFTVNGYGVDVAAPFGGFKQSGLGREGGLEGLAPYQETKAVFLPEGFIPAAWARS